MLAGLYHSFALSLLQMLGTAVKQKYGGSFDGKLGTSSDALVFTTSVLYGEASVAVRVPRDKIDRVILGADTAVHQLQRGHAKVRVPLISGRVAKEGVTSPGSRG